MSKTGLSRLLDKIERCTLCKEHLPDAPRPVLRVSTTASVLIVGQAPGARVHASGIPWDDASGKRLRQWLGMDRKVFHDATRIAIMPVGFCYPGTSPAGGDLPPRNECAPMWHGKVLAHLDRIALTVLVGNYAHARFLGDRRRNSVTETVSAWRHYLPNHLVLPHPSWRTIAWQARNPWFDDELLPDARRLMGRLTG